MSATLSLSLVLFEYCYAKYIRTVCIVRIMNAQLDHNLILLLVIFSGAPNIVMSHECLNFCHFESLESFPHDPTMQPPRYYIDTRVEKLYLLTLTH